MKWKRNGIMTNMENSMFDENENISVVLVNNVPYRLEDVADQEELDFEEEEV